MTTAIQTRRESPELARLGLLSRDQRRAQGSIYTPPDVVELVLDQAFGPGMAPTAAALDPACGTGVFLRAMVDRIAQEFRAAGRPLDGVDRIDFMTRVRKVIWGLDVDAVAVKLARSALEAQVFELTGTPAPGAFDANVCVADFLMGESAGSLVPRPTTIVGNPPYVPTDRIDRAAKASFRLRFTTAFGRFDLYTLFMERAISLVAPSGRFVFITPDKYLSTQSARPLRELLGASGHVTRVIRFDSHRVFDGAAVVPCITVWQEGRATRDADVVSGWKAEPLASTLGTLVNDPARGEALRSGGGHFRRSSSRLLELLDSDHPTLDQVSSRISAGPATGLNGAFILSSDEAADIEPELVHPTARGRDIGAFVVRDSSQRFLVPYVWDDAGRAHLIDLDDYPRAAGWLGRHRDALERRHCVRAWGKAWWALHDPVPVDFGRLEKILVPDIARSNRFAVDNHRVPQHSAYYIVPKPELAADCRLLAILLNSPVIEYLIRVRAPLVKDGFSRYRRQFLADLPVPTLDAVTAAELRSAHDLGDGDAVGVITCQIFGVTQSLVREGMATLSEMSERKTTRGAS